MAKSSHDSDEPLTRVHLYIYESDKEFFMQHFGGSDGHGFSKIIRKIIRVYRKQLEEKVNDRALAPSLPAID